MTDFILQVVRAARDLLTPFLEASGYTQAEQHVTISSVIPTLLNLKMFLKMAMEVSIY